MRIGMVMQKLGQGGLEELAIRLCLALQEAGHQTSILALEDGPLGARLTSLGLPYLCFAKPQGVNFRLFGRLWMKVVRSFDLLHTHHFGPLFYTTPGAKLAGIPVIHTMHSNEHLIDASKRHRMMMRGGLSLARTVTTVHDGLRDFLIEQWPTLGRKVVSIPNGIDTDVFHGEYDTSALRAELGLLEARPVIGCVARLSPEKGHDTLLDVIPRLKHKPYVLIVGDGVAREALQQKAASLGVNEQLRWVGNRHDIPELLSLLDVFVLASKREGLPLAALEALSSRVPLVTTDVGGLPSLIEESLGGRSVCVGDVEAMTSSIDSMLEDSTMRQACGINGRAWVVNRASFQSMFRHYLVCYSEALGVPLVVGRG